MKESFYIKYRIFNNNKLIKESSTTMKDQPNQFMAQCKLEELLKQEHPEMTRMEISSCIRSFKNPLDELLGIFK